MADESIFNEDDIIAETPQKVKKKNPQKLKLTTFPTLKNTAHDLSNELCVIKNDSQSVKARKFRKENVHMEYKSPYVFYEMKDVLNFTEFYQPCNINIKMIGIYKPKHINVHYLMEFKKSCPYILPMKILIDLKLVNSFPVDEQAIEVYGFIKFCENKSKPFSVFVINFWNNIGVNFDRYLECLRKQKLHVPNCYKKIKEDVHELTELNINKSTDYSFAEFDESCLIKSLDYIEEISHEMDQIMHISEDIFK